MVHKVMDHVVMLDRFADPAAGMEVVDGEVNVIVSQIADEEKCEKRLHPSGA